MLARPLSSTLRVLPRFLPSTPILRPPSVSSSSQFIRSYAKKKSGGGKKGKNQTDEEDPTDVPLIQTKGKKGKGKELARVGDEESQVAFDMGGLERGMDEAVERLRVGLKGIVGRVGRVSPALLDGVRVEDVDGKRRPLNEFALVSVKDGKDLLVTVYEESLLKPVTKSLTTSSLSLNPQPLTPTSLLVPIPRPDWDKRQSLVRQASEICEASRIAIRAVRTKGQKDIKAAFTSKEDVRSEGKELDARTKKRTDVVDGIFEDAKRVLMDE